MLKDLWGKKKDQRPFLIKKKNKTVNKIVKMIKSMYFGT